MVNLLRNKCLVLNFDFRGSFDSYGGGGGCCCNQNDILLPILAAIAAATFFLQMLITMMGGGRKRRRRRRTFSNEYIMLELSNEIENSITHVYN